MLVEACCCIVLMRTDAAVEDEMAPCKFAEKVWNAQEAGAQGVRASASYFAHLSVVAYLDVGVMRA